MAWSCPLLCLYFTCGSSGHILSASKFCKRFLWELLLCQDSRCTYLSPSQKDSAKLDCSYLFEGTNRFDYFHLYINFFLEEIYISIDVISHNKLGTKARLTCREKKKSDPKKGFIPSLFFWARETNSVESYFWQCLNCSSFFSFFLKGLIVLYSPKLWGQSQCSYEIIKLSVSLWLIGICILPYLSLINSFNFNISNWISNLFKIHAPTILYSYIIEQFQFCP